MSLAELWSTSKEQLEGKQVRQTIAFAGAGQLSDGAPTALAFREFLGLVPSEYLGTWGRCFVVDMIGCLVRCKSWDR